MQFIIRPTVITPNSVSISILVSKPSGFFSRTPFAQEFIDFYDIGHKIEHNLFPFASPVLGWTAILVCLGLRGHLGSGTFRAKARRVTGLPVMDAVRTQRHKLDWLAGVSWSQCGVTQKQIHKRRTRVQAVCLRGDCRKRRWSNVEDKRDKGGNQKAGFHYGHQELNLAESPLRNRVILEMSCKKMEQELVY